MAALLENGAKVRFGILGAASIAKKNAFVIFTSEQCVLAAIASRDEKKARDFLSNNGLGKCDATVYSSYDALLADDSIDAVYMPLPTKLHLEWVRKAAEAKKRTCICVCMYVYVYVCVL